MSKKLICFIAVVVLAFSVVPIYSTPVSAAGTSGTLAGCKLQMSSKTLTINSGSSRQLRVTYSPLKPSRIISTTAINYYGKWTSSNNEVAQVSAKGKVKALKAGRATIKFRLWTGAKARCRVIVPAKASAKGSVYLYNGSCQQFTRALAGASMVEGTDNRLNGRIISDKYITKAVYQVRNAEGKIIFSKTKKKSGVKNIKLSCEKISLYSLPAGSMTFSITVTNTAGTVELYKTAFSVTGQPAVKYWGRKAAEWAQYRLGDPYPANLYGTWQTADTTDCSNLTLWSYYQATGQWLMPRTAADQYRYCVKYGTKLTRDQLHKGDLVFKGGADNGRYKDICHVAMYIGSGMVIEANGTKVAIGQNFKYGKIYYGRPFKL